MKKLWLVLAIPLVLASCNTTPAPDAQQTATTQGHEVTLCGTTLRTQSVQPVVPTDPQPNPRPPTGGGSNVC